MNAPRQPNPSTPIEPKSTRLVFRSCALLAALLLMTSAVQARPRAGHGPRPALAAFERGLEHLDLEPSTRSEAYALLDTARAEGRVQRVALRAAHETLRGLLDQDPVDDTALLNESETLSALLVQAHQTRLRALLGLRALLTLEQWQGIRPDPEARGRPARR